MSAFSFRLKQMCFVWVITGLLLGQSGFTPRPMAVKAAPSASAVVISYIGLDKIHLSYAMDCPPSGDETPQLRAALSGGTLVVLVSGSLSGVYEHKNIPKDATQVYYELGYLKTSDDSFRLCTSAWQSLPPESYGGSRGGTLLFDETLDSNQGFPSLKLDITVPAGKTLTFGSLDCTYGSTIKVYGTLKIAESAPRSNGYSPSIDFYVPFHLQQNLLSGYTFNFNPGSEGSTFAGDGAGSSINLRTEGGSPMIVSGNNWYISINRDYVNLEIRDAKNFGLNMNNYGETMLPQGVVNIRNSEGSIGTLLQIYGSGQLNLIESKISAASPITLELNDQATLQMDRVTMNASLKITGTSNTSFEIKTSGFLYEVDATSTGQANISGNEFYTYLYINVGGTMTVTDNVFLDHLGLMGSSSGSSLVVNNNSFIVGNGLYGFSAPVGSVSIDKNFFGDIEGPSKDPFPAFLTSRGAYSDAPIVAGNWTKAGKYQSGDRFFPKIWLINYIIGQNTIPHLEHGAGTRMLQGRKTLVSLDIGVGVESLSGLKVYALLDGKRIDAEPIGSLYRDSYNTSPAKMRLGKSTVNIILPEVLNPTATLQVFADTSGVTGPDVGRPAGNQFELLALTLSFTIPQSLSLEVVPVDLGGLCRRRVADTQETIRVITGELPERFPVARSDVTVITRPSYYFFCTLGDMTNYVFIPKLLASVAMLSALGPYSPNRTVIVAPSGSMYKVEGANPWYARGTLVVDESKPMAVMHELGHSVGLYLDTEQYDLPEYMTTDGIPIEGASAFSPEGDVWINNLKSSVIHFPSPKMWWFGWDTKLTITDIMSANDTVWPIPSTLSALDFSPVIRTNPDPVEPAPAEDANEDARQMFLWGLMQSDGLGNYHVMPGSTQVFDITGIPTTRWNPYRCRQTIPGGKTLYWQYTDSYYSTFGSSEIKGVAANTTLAPVEAFCKVMSVNITGATRMTLGEAPQDGSLMSQNRSYYDLPTLSVSPTSGSSLGSQVSLGWTGSLGQSGDTAPHWVWFSPDGGLTWQPAGMPTAVASLSIDTDFLPVGSNIAIQVFTSDGFQQSMQQIDNLSLANRPPQVSISAPFEGITAPAGTAWDLAGSAYDLEDGVNITSTWESSLDGVLGSSNMLLGVTLSPGSHTLTFRATDQAGLSASIQRQVSVGAVIQADLALTQSSLKLHLDGSGPTASDPLYLTQEKAHTLEVQLQGAGVPITATLALYITAPGGSETLIVRQTLSIEAFSTGVLMAALTPTVPGAYHIRAVIESASLSDPNAVNNQFIWNYSTAPQQVVPGKIYLPILVR